MSTTGSHNAGKNKSKADPVDDVAIKNAPVQIGKLNAAIKVHPPAMFDGKKARLNGFLLQLKLFLYFHEERFSSDIEKVLYAVTLLKGPALDWIEGFTNDYINKRGDNGELSCKMSKETIKNFGDFEGFEAEICHMQNLRIFD
ncbi:hypothetical protein B7494_g4698 [Chlorociboria aeruginascens]|nr:hypothetical protein B7494_g4698 [Chlorociboria aeruginascens]